MTVGPLAMFEAEGIRLFTPDGATLRVDAPSGAITDGLRDQLRKHKDELLRAVQRRELEAWSERGWLLLFSEHLGEVITLARDDRAAAGAPAGAIVYTADEIKHLRGTAPDALRLVHEAKRNFGGRITGKEAAHAGYGDARCN